MKKLLMIAALCLFTGIAFGQALKKGNVIGTHAINVTLKADVTMNQFLDFLESKWKPEIDNNLTGVTMFILKGDRGENENGFGFLYLVESMEVRDTHWPEEGKAGDEMSAMAAKLSNMIEEFVVSMTTEYTDWVIL